LDGSGARLQLRDEWQALHSLIKQSGDETWIICFDNHAQLTTEKLEHLFTYLSIQGEQLA
jgi:hypothetical protein